MAGLAHRSIWVCLPLWLQLPTVGAEFISDIAAAVRPSAVDESRALEMKAESFWQAVLTSAEQMKMAEHLSVCAEADQVIAALPQENEFVRKALSDSVERLRRADDTVLANAVKSSELASARLASPAGESGFSFFTSGNFMKKALQRFVSGGHYSERLLEHVEQRQADILPTLQGVAGSTGKILTDVREASKLGFDVLKYDLYNKGVPKTPQAAKVVAHKLVDAAGETRHNFMQFITKTVNSIGQDFKDRSDDATATVARASFRAADSRPGAGAAAEILNL